MFCVFLNIDASYKAGIFAGYILPTYNRLYASKQRMFFRLATIYAQIVTEGIEILSLMKIKQMLVNVIFFCSR